MSITMQFEGHSDDEFWVRNGDASVIQDNAADGRPMIFIIESPTGGGMYVWGQYSGRIGPRGRPLAG